MSVSYRQPGVVLTDRRFTVPIDHEDPTGETIELYAREVVASDKASRENLPWLLYLQGGPGFGANRFVGRQAWLVMRKRRLCCLAVECPVLQWTVEDATIAAPRLG